MNNPNSLKFEYWLETPAQMLEGMSKEEIVAEVKGSLTIWISNIIWVEEHEIHILKFCEYLNSWVQQPNERDFEFHIEQQEQALAIKLSNGRVIISAAYPQSPLNSIFSKEMVWPILTGFLQEMKQDIQKKYEIEL